MSGFREHEYVNPSPHLSLLHPSYQANAALLSPRPSENIFFRPSLRALYLLPHVSVLHLVSACLPICSLPQLANQHVASDGSLCPCFAESSMFGFLPNGFHKQGLRAGNWTAHKAEGPQQAASYFLWLVDKQVVPWIHTKEFNPSPLKPEALSKKWCSS